MLQLWGGERLSSQTEKRKDLRELHSDLLRETLYAIKGVGRITFFGAIEKNLTGEFLERYVRISLLERKEQELKKKRSN